MKLGILGLGRIADKVVDTTLAHMKEVELYAAGSRNIEKAEAFKKKFGFAKAYGSYEELVSDPEVELVYICTPHSEHYDNVKLCIAHKKNILCEKSFMLNAEQAKEVVALAKEAKVFLAEAMWPRYKGITKKITQAINSGIIGRVGFLNANLFYPVTDKDRIVDLALGGGALLDVGIYPLNFALTHFGFDIERIESCCVKTESGVDESDSITVIFKDGKMADLTTGITTRSDRHAVFYGEKGYMVVDSVNTPTWYEVRNTEDKVIERYEDPNEISGYEYEFRECISCIENGKLESNLMPLSDTVRIMEVMDEIRSQWNMKFPQEEK